MFRLVVKLTSFQAAIRNEIANTLFQNTLFPG